MTALKFADFMLPNSKYIWRIPLVKCIFDETESPRIPRGRGVIPDVYVPLTYEEVAFTDGDAILARALQMIAEGEYLKDNPLEEASDPQSRDMTALIVITALISALSVLLAVVAGKRRRKNKTGA